MKNKKMIWVLLIISVLVIIGLFLFIFFKKNGLITVNLNKEQLIGEWKVENDDFLRAIDTRGTGEKFEFLSLELYFNSKGDMQLYSTETGVRDYTPKLDYRYSYSFNGSKLKITKSKYFPESYFKDYVPSSVQLKSDGKLLVKFKDGTKLYFTKVSDTTDVDFEEEYNYNQIELDKINSKKAETRKFAEKYFKEKSIEYDESTAPRSYGSGVSVSLYECIYSTSEGTIYIIDKDECSFSNGYLEYIEHDGDWTISHRCKYEEVDGYIITKLEDVK